MSAFFSAMTFVAVVVTVLVAMALLASITQTGLRKVFFGLLKISILATAVLFLSSKAFAEPTATFPFTNTSLTKFAENGNDEDYIAVASYLNGVMDAGDGTLHCVPASIGASMRVEFYVKYLKYHPEKMGDNAGKTMTGVLARAFPCKKAAAGK